MTPDSHTLQHKIIELEFRLKEAEETLRAIRGGEVDALVVAGPEGDQIFTLQGAETPYRFLIEEMNEGALLLVPDGTVLYANVRFAEMSHRPLQQVIGEAWPEFFPDAERAAARGLLGTAKKPGVKAEFHLQPNGNPPRPVEVSIASMKRDGVEGFSVIVTDLTERRTAEQALRDSNARLRELVADLERFSYSISHDMRAPLRAMKSFAELLEQQYADAPQLQNPEWLGRISTAASRLDALIQGALDYAKVVKQDWAMERVDLSRLLEDLLETYPNLLPDKAGIRIEAPLPVVMGNEAALTQVFSNLIGNAVKFVQPKTYPSVLLRATGGTHESLTRVWVEDNGIGVPPEARERIFEMFQRANRTYEGTGIGLAVVRKIVERMGGRVGVESEPGKGSRFWVELRLAGREEESAENRESARVL